MIFAQVLSIKAVKKENNAVLIILIFSCRFVQKVNYYQTMKLSTRTGLSTLIFFSASLLLSSCGGSDKKAEGTASDTSAVAEQAPIEQNYFQVPLPAELFRSLQQNGIKARPNLLNPVENIASYTTATFKSLNFGVYSSDLFFCSTFDQKADVLKYFENLKKLSDDLGISSVVTDETMKRIEKNLSNKDSLNAITDKVFFEASNNLEESGQGGTLALVIAGGLTESIYLSTRLADKFTEGSKVMQIIADQKLPLANLYEYMDKYPQDANVAEARKMIDPLKVAYDGLKEEAHTPAQSKDGKKVIGGETHLMITAADYTKIQEAAATVRASISKTNAAKN